MVFGWRHAWNRLRKRAGNVILMYHRVADTTVDPWNLCVSPANFAAQMEVLATKFSPAHLSDICGKPDGRQRVAVTFDDGYVDNLHVAKPILERFGVPATVFVSTGYIGLDRGFWWDRLEEVFLHPGTLPSAPLSLELAGKPRTWVIMQADQEYREIDCVRYREWVAWRDPPPTSRHAAFYELWKDLAPLPEPGREIHLQAVSAWAGREPVPTAVCMTAAELRTLFDGDLVHPGGHTISHRRLSALTRTEQEFEIQGSRMRLQEILSRTVEDFSYPFGGQRDYTRDCVRAVERAGYLRACSNIHGTVGLGTSRFELPRVHVVNVGGAAFASFLGSL